MACLARGQLVDLPRRHQRSALSPWPDPRVRLLVPAVVSVPYVSRRSLHRYLGASLTVSSAVTALGVFRGRHRVLGRDPEWVIDAVNITSSRPWRPCSTMLSLRPTGPICSACSTPHSTANDDLRRSEEALADAVDGYRPSRAGWWRPRLRATAHRPRPARRVTAATGRPRTQPVRRAGALEAVTGRGRRRPRPAAGLRHRCPGGPPARPRHLPAGLRRPTGW